MDIIKNFLQNNILGVLALFITPFLAWFFGRRRENAEIRMVDADSSATIVDSSGKVVKIWESFATNMEDRYAECMRKTNVLEAKYELMLNHNFELEQRMDKSKRLNDDLALKVNDFSQKNQNLKEYTEKLVIFVETLLSQIEKVSPELAQINKQELARLRTQFQNE